MVTVARRLGYQFVSVAGREAMLLYVLYKYLLQELHYIRVGRLEVDLQTVYGGVMLLHHILYDNILSILYMYQSCVHWVNCTQIISSLNLYDVRRNLVVRSGLISYYLVPRFIHFILCL